VPRSRRAGGGAAVPGEAYVAPKLIRLEQAENLIAAAGYAVQLGVPLNRHVTIMWERAGIVGRVQDYQREFLQLMSKWLIYHGTRPAYCWAIENGQLNGLHGHIVAHVPPALFKAFRVMLNRWLTRLGGSVDRGTIKVTRVRYGTRDGHQLNAIKGLVKYILKGLEHQAGELIGVRVNPYAAGMVVGKRIGFSQSLGPTARARSTTSPPLAA